MILYSEEIALQLQQDEMTLQQIEHQHLPQAVNHVTTATTQTQCPPQSGGRQQSNKVSDAAAGRVNIIACFSL